MLECKQLLPDTLKKQILSAITSKKMFREQYGVYAY